MRCAKDGAQQCTAGDVLQRDKNGSRTLLANSGQSVNYVKRYEIYLARICLGLRMRKRWARDLFTRWDSILFPHAEDSLDVVLSANQKSEEDELDKAMGIFDDAPSVPVPLFRSKRLLIAAIRTSLLTFRCLSC